MKKKITKNKKIMAQKPRAEITRALKNNLKYLATDGGGIELVKVDKKNGIVEIRMTGACCGCPMKQFTFSKMIAEKLQKNISWLRDVKLIE